MFRPGGNLVSFWVTIAKAHWGWGATATNGSGRANDWKINPKTVRKITFSWYRSTSEPDYTKRALEDD